MGDPTPAGDGLDPIVAEIRGMQKQTRDLEKSSGTQRAQTVKRLEQTIEDLSVVVDDLSAVVSAQAAQLTFLQTQTAFDSKVSLLPFSGSNSGVTWFAYQSPYNASVTVTTGASGLLVISPSALLSGGGALSALIGVEIVGISGPSAPAPGMLMVGGTVSLSSSSTFRVALSAYTTYTIRTRHGADGTGSGACIWGYQALSVTRQA